MRVAKGKPILESKDGRFTFLDAKGELGWKDLALQVTTDRGIETLGEAVTTRARGGLVLAGRYPASGLEETATLAPGANDSLVLSRKLTNTKPFSLTIADASVGMCQESGRPVFAGQSGWRARFAHFDNLRIERFPWCRPEAPYVRSLPVVPTWFGEQESQALPVMIFTRDDYAGTLVEGQLRQDKSRVRWHLAAAADGSLLQEYRLSWQFHTGGITLQAGETLCLEPIFYQILRDTHPQTALEGYFAAALARNEFRQEGNILHSTAFYCSWNYGIFQQINEESLLKTARAIHKHLPGIRHFLIDGGWQSHTAVSCPDCANLYLPEAERCDHSKFPHGMKVMADKLRAAGVVPAIWWTPSVDLSSKLARENPGWLAKDAAGAPYRIGHSGYLDYSLPAVQDYYRHCFQTIFRDWGYEAMKMDFWSQGVESNQIRFASGTGIEWRDWLLGTIRSYLPADGFLMTCVATAHGNIFLGKHAHTYRACIDVGAAAWHEHVYGSCWVQPLLPIPGRQTCLLNVDGLGVNAGISDDENLHRLTYGFITMGSFEIDGRLEELKPRHLAWLQRLTANIDRGYPVMTADSQAFTGAPFPRVLYVRYPAGSPTAKRGVAMHVALFNWSDEPEYVGVTLATLGLSGAVRARDFWTDRSVRFGADGLCELLPRRSARLYEVPR